MKLLPDFKFPKLFVEPAEVLARGEEALEEAIEEAEEKKEKILNYLKNLHDDAKLYKFPIIIVPDREKKEPKLVFEEKIRVVLPIGAQTGVNGPEVLVGLRKYCEWLITEGAPEALKEMRRLKRVPVEEIKKNPERVEDYLRPLWLLNAIEVIAMRCWEPKAEARVSSSLISIAVWLPGTKEEMFFKDPFEILKEEELPVDRSAIWGFIPPRAFSVREPGTVPQEEIVSAFRGELGETLRRTLERGTLKYYSINPWPLICRGKEEESVNTVGIGYGLERGEEAFSAFHFWTKEPPELLSPVAAFREALRELRSA